MLPQEALKLLNNQNTSVPLRMREQLDKWRRIYYAMSLHTSGICPYYKSLDSNREITIPFTNLAVASATYSYNGFISPSGTIDWEYQFLFDKILFSRHPREDEDTRWWRFSQYRPMTKAPFGQITEVVVGAIFQDSNYSVNINDTKDNDYIWGNNFYGYNLINYIANIAYKSIVEDPNGYIVRIPKNDYKYYQGSKEVEIDVFFVKSRDIKFITDDEIIFLKDGYAWHITKTTIFRYTQREDKQFELAKEDKEGYYAHMFGKLPISKAGGIWNAQGFFDSYYDKAKPVADEFISAYSASQMVNKEASHPYIIESDVECPSCQGTGYHAGEAPDYIKESCRPCHGTGKIARYPGQRMIAPASDMDKKLIQIINPDVSINKLHMENTASLMENIIEALNLTKAQQSQSGVAKAIDQERLYKFISLISNDLFDRIITDTLRDIIAYRNVVSTDGVVSPAITDFTIVKPTQFQIKTAADLLQEYKDGTDADLPVFILQKMALDYIDKQYSGDDILKKKAEFIMCFDPLSVYNNADIIARVNAGINTKMQAVINNMLPLWLDDVVEEKGSEWFVQAQEDKIEEALKPIMDEYFAENPLSDIAPSTNIVEEKNITQGT